MHKRARTVLCGGRSAMVVPTALLDRGRACTLSDFGAQEFALVGKLALFERRLLLPETPGSQSQPAVHAAPSSVVCTVTITPGLLVDQPSSSRRICHRQLLYRVRRKAVSDDFSSVFNESPKGCPGTGRACTPWARYPVGM